MQPQEAFPEEAIEFSYQAQMALAGASPDQFSDFATSLWEVVEIGIGLREGEEFPDRPARLIALVRQFFTSDSSIGLLSTYPTVIALFKRRHPWGLRIESITFPKPLLN